MAPWNFFRAAGITVLGPHAGRKDGDGFGRRGLFIACGRRRLPWSDAHTAAQALEYRLVNHVSDDLDATVDWLLGRLLDKSPAAIRRGLYTMKKIEAMAFEESMAFTESQIGLFALTEDAAEGQLAFREKRKPQWSGR